MSKNQAVTLKNLNDILFFEKEIVRNVEREHIFEMKDKKKNSLGFISSHDLKNYIAEHNDSACDYDVRNIDSTEWISVFMHPSFQRRKPQIVPTSNMEHDDDQHFFILVNGQKDGPYKKDELRIMLENKDLLLTDMVTANSGHTWMKLFQLDHFERRVLKESDQLPSIPNQKLMGANDSATAIIPATDAISSLAYLSNIKRGKSTEKDKIEIYKAGATVQKNSSSIYKWLLIGSVVGIAYFGFHIKNQLTSPFKEKSKSIGEQAEMLRPVESTETHSPPQTTPNAAVPKIGEKNSINQINDSQRNVEKFEARVLRPVRPANKPIVKPDSKKSFMNTSKYQNANTNEVAEDPNYFYDNTSAMELDPVRSQVSKENFDNPAAEVGEPTETLPPTEDLFDQGLIESN